MAPIAGRQKRTDGTPAQLLQARVDPELKVRVFEAAKAVGLSVSAYVEQALAHAQEELDDDGKPVWWARQTKNPGQEELPLNRAS